jgi:hypothetical protein
MTSTAHTNSKTLRKAAAAAQFTLKTVIYDTHLCTAANEGVLQSPLLRF